MKPKHYPYSRQKKQSDKQIVKLESKLTICATDISLLASRINIIERKQK